MKTRDTHLGDLSKRTTLLSEVDDDSAASGLSLFDGLLDAKDEVRAASADIGTEDVAAVALVDR